MNVKVKGLVVRPCLTLFDPMDCSPPGSFVHGILQARILEWVAISSSRGSSWSRELNPGLLHCRQILYILSYQGSPTDIELNLRDRVLDEVEKSSFIALPSKGEHSELMLKTVCPQLVGWSEEFSRNGSKRAWSSCGHSSYWLGGEVSGSEHHQISGSMSGVYMFVASIPLNSPTW